MTTAVQLGIEKQRAVYETLRRPLLAQLCTLHQVSIREFASIFGISKSFAEELLNHRKLPSVELALRIARYWEVSVDELFGWRVDDDGARRPLLVALPGGKRLLRLKASNKKHNALQMVLWMADSMEEACTTSE